MEKASTNGNSFGKLTTSVWKINISNYGKALWEINIYGKSTTMEKEYGTLQVYV